MGELYRTFMSLLEEEEMPTNGFADLEGSEEQSASEEDVELQAKIQALAKQTHGEEESHTRGRSHVKIVDD